MKIKSTYQYYLLLVFLSIFIASCTTQERDNYESVNPFIGTDFHGHTYPGATLPFGAVQLSPDTRKGNWDACAGYHYSDTTLIGFSHTHLSGTGCIDFGDILFRPIVKQISPSALSTLPPLPFSHKHETAHPGYYEVDLPSIKVNVQLTATPHVGVHRYDFAHNPTAAIVVDLSHSLDKEQLLAAQIHQSDSNEIRGMRNTNGWVEQQQIYFVAQFSAPIHHIEYVDSTMAILYFSQPQNSVVEAKVGLSIVSCDNAAQNLQSETAHKDFQQLRNLAKQTWQQQLSKIQIKGASQKQRTIFYTALYHSLIVPNVVSDVNGQYRTPKMQIATSVPHRQSYSTFSFWDTFRAWHPLMTLIDTSLVNNIIQSSLDFYQHTGKLPIWSLSSGETNTMIGYHAVSVIADAYLRGIRGYDTEKALEAMIATAEQHKKGAEEYRQYGFIPSNFKRQSVSSLLEFSYDDWCIAMMAKSMRRDSIYHIYAKRAQSYVNAFNGATLFFQGKRNDGNWQTPFNPLHLTREYTEANAWQYRFFVPHDINGLVQLFGGKRPFIIALDSLFSIKTRVKNDIEDVTGLIGQYAQGNEPSHHIAFLYNYVGQPWKTQAMVRRILTEKYDDSPDGICGNEDCGQMSAWYILSALGLYPVCPGSGQFSLTSPLFEEATVTLANGHLLTIRANNPLHNTYIDKVTLRGHEIKENFIDYDELMKGGELKFYLTSHPNKQRGAHPQSYPSSMTKGHKVSVPYIDKDVYLFADTINVYLLSATPDASIYYTLDGSIPTMQSLLYTQPLHLSATTPIRAVAVKEGFLPSDELKVVAKKAIYLPSLSLKPSTRGVNAQYYEGPCSSVKDIAALLEVCRGIISYPSIVDAPAEDHFAYKFSGLIYTPQTGIYTFQTKSDDGSVLMIDNHQVVNNDGSHAAISATGKVALEKGWHRYKILYFEDYEGQHFEWKWKKPNDKEYVSIPMSYLCVK